MSVPPGICFVFPHALFCFMYRSCVSYTGIEYGTTLVTSAFSVGNFWSYGTYRCETYLVPTPSERSAISGTFVMGPNQLAHCGIACVPWLEKYRYRWRIRISVLSRNLREKIQPRILQGNREEHTLS